MSFIQQYKKTCLTYNYVLLGMFFYINMLNFIYSLKKKENSSIIEQ